MINCEFENGSKTSLRHACVDVVVLNSECTQVLLVKRASNMHLEPGKWVVPGGYVDRDELIIDAARREVLEETGYELESINFIKFTDKPEKPGDDRQSITFIYEAIVGAKIGDPDNESEDVSWFDFGNIPSKDEFGFDHRSYLKKFLK